MNVLAKILRGDNVRPTRLHTEAGEYCGGHAIPGAIWAVWSWIRQRVTGRYSVLPWWVYQAIRDIDESLHSTDRVLEIGGGYSTLWLGQRCQAVCSIEESQAWANIVSAKTRELRLGNVEILLGDSRSTVAKQIASADWDVVVIDGPRDRLEIFLDLLASSSNPRLIIYDDTDKLENRAAVDENLSGYKRVIYRGFKPQTIHACETTVFYRVP